MRRRSNHKAKWNAQSRLPGCVLTVLLLFLFRCSAAEGVSGHPAGMETGRHAPGRTFYVMQANPAASDRNPGTRVRPLATIAAATALAGPDDTIIIGTGLYREAIRVKRGGQPGRPLRILAAPGADVLITGSDPLSPEEWRRSATHFRLAQNCSVWQRPAKALATVQASVQAAKSRRGPFVFRREQLFLDGALLAQVPATNQLKPMTWTMGESSNRMYLCLAPNDSPTNHLMEWSTRACLLGGTMRWVEVGGLHFTHACNDAQQPGVSLVGADHCLLEDVTVTWANGAGVRVDGSRDCTLYRVRASYNGCTGISGHDVKRLRLESCQTDYNNQKGYPVGWESGGVKLLHIRDSVIENLVSCCNDGFGLWLDWACSRNHVTRSVCIGNTQAGFNVEASRGPNWIDNSIAAFNGSKGSFWNCGFYAHDTDKLRLAHNLACGNLGGGIRIRYLGGRTNNFDHRVVTCRGNLVFNNLILDNGPSGITFPVDGRWTGDNHSDGNLIWSDKAAAVLERAPGNREEWARLKLWVSGQRASGAPLPQVEEQPASVFLSLAQWRKLTGNDTHSKFERIALTDPQKGDFRCRKASPPSAFSLKQALAGWSEKAPAPWNSERRWPIGPFEVQLNQTALFRSLRLNDFLHPDKGEMGSAGR